MPNPENLKNGVKTQFKRGDDAARRAGEKGNRSQKVQRDCRALAKMILESGAPISAKQKKAIADLLGLTVEEVTVNVAGTFAQAKRAIKGDRYAMEYLRDTAGEKPTENVAISTADFGALDAVTYDGPD